MSKDKETKGHKMPVEQKIEQAAERLLADKDTSTLNPGINTTSPTAPLSSNPTYEQALGFELQQHAILSVEYKKKIDEAKTEVKRKYYEKKIAKNNNKALQLLLTLEEVNRLQANPNKVADLVATKTESK